MSDIWTIEILTAIIIFCLSVHRHSSRHSRSSRSSLDSRYSHERRRSRTPMQYEDDEANREEDLVQNGQPVAVQDAHTAHTAAHISEQQTNTHVIVETRDTNRQVLTQTQDDTEPHGGEVVLDPKILEVMGKRFIEDRVLDAAIPNDLKVRWEEIVKKGMPTEDRVALIEKYPPPKNCCIIDPPKINSEVRVSLQETTIKRDERIEAKQAKITACLAAVGKTFSGFLQRYSGNENLDFFEQLSDIGRLLADLQHDESNIRKSLILANLGAPFKDVLNGTTPDEFLFGKQLEERLKAAKALESCKKDLIVRTTTKPQNNGSKNSKFPPRRPQGNQRQVSSTLGGKKPQYTRTQHPPSNRRSNQRYESNWKTNRKYESHRQRRY
ncbi:uncharacterized protein LOC124406220 [Diprion similis]|uniref:uncharacterized protein LOC124406220 n=1 Tax=Diprion similis TaxID=362088 RepID=UPI001EF930B4|nr:uncharacterized protein LOC124406220 [Diprion similis]